MNSSDGKTKIYYLPSDSDRWYRASLRRDLRKMGMLDAPETDEEREILKTYRPHQPGPHQPGHH